MSALTRQQLCAEMSVSESTVRRWEQAGLPYMPIGIRGKRYNLEECKTWLQGAMFQFEQNRRHTTTPPSWHKASEFAAASRKVRLRVMPSR